MSASTKPGTAKPEIVKSETIKRTTDSQMEELREAFRFFDRNQNGSIEPEELGSVMTSLGYCATESELKDMIHEADVDGNGKIDFKEFVRMMELKTNERPEQAEDEELREAFKVFDRDGNGLISRAELSQVMGNLGEQLSEKDLNDMISEADKNGDGQIDYEEFVQMVAKK
ncbi:calmodulin-like [Ciona intestinalis]